MRLRAPAQLVGALASVCLIAGVASAQTRPNEARPSAAESLRQFLAGRSALAAPWNFSPTLQDLYATPSVEKPSGCPVRTFRDAPVKAEPSAVNIFPVDFKAGLDATCRDAPDPRTCAAIRNSCMTVETSVFCDLKYLRMRQTIADLAYQSGWKGLRGVPSGKSALFPALPREALIDLARMTSAARQDRKEPDILSAVPQAREFARRARSSVHDFAAWVSLLAPLLHEVAHIEQSYCGRGVATEGKDDFVARMMLTGQQDYATTARLYQNLTCSRLSRPEFDADIRSMDMLLRYLEKEAPATIAAPRFTFASDVDNATRDELRELARWTREIALLAFMYGSEYELLVYDQPERGLKLVREEPDAPAIEPYTGYYIRAGDDPTIPRTLGHLEPAFRVVTLSRSLRIERLELSNRGKAVALTHLRVAPFAVGRFASMRGTECKLRETDAGARAVAEYVFGAFQPATATPAAGPGLPEARTLLARFMEQGADRVALTRALRPTLADYRTVFAQPFADKAYQHYERAWQGSGMEITLEPAQIELLVQATSSDDLRRDGGAGALPGGYQKVASVIQPGHVIYSWRYVEPGKRFGIIYDGLYHVNGRWVFIPKPYRVE